MMDATKETNQDLLKLNKDTVAESHVVEQEEKEIVVEKKKPVKRKKAVKKDAINSGK